MKSNCWTHKTEFIEHTGQWIWFWQSFILTQMGVTGIQELELVVDGFTEEDSKHDLGRELSHL